MLQKTTVARKYFPSRILFHFQKYTLIILKRGHLLKKIENHQNLLKNTFSAVFDGEVILKNLELSQLQQKLENFQNC